MSNIEIPEIPMDESEQKQEVHYHYKVPKAKGPLNGESFINGVIITTVIVLFIGMLATYFVSDLPDFVIGLRELTMQAIWVIIGGYAIGELLKIVFINRARSSKEYKEAKSDAEKELKKIAEQNNCRIREYCALRTEEIFINNRKSMLAESKISLNTFEERYQALSTREILKRYPNDNLSKKQLHAIKRANAVKREIYNPNFLVSIQHDNVMQVPSARYNSEKRNIKNSILSMIFSIIAGIFGVTLANGIIFDFSAAVVLTVIIKILVLLFTIALKLIFVNSLVFKTEIGRFELQKTEAKAYLRWYDEVSQ